MKFKNKKLLILAGAGPHCKVVETAKEMGIYTIVADYLPSSAYAPAKLIADENLLCDISDTRKLVEYCITNNVDGVLGFCIDPAQRPAFEIADQLGIRTFGSYEQVLALTDKTVFKQLCRDNGVDVVPEYEESSIETIEYPVLVKPIDSRGSRGAKVCYNRNELLEALPLAKKESSNGGAIVEKYMGNNQDLTITYIVKDSIPYLISIGDRFPGRKEDNLDRQNSCVVQPSRYTDMYLKNVNSRVINMIKNLGIKNGPVFMQGFVDGNTVRMYDPGIRIPGNEYERIYKQATGLDPMKSIISYIIGGEIFDYDGKIRGSYNLNGMTAIQYMINVGPGKINSFEGLEKIAEHPNVINVQQRHFIGDVIENTGDIKHRAGEISILVDRDAEKMADIIKYIQSCLKITDETGVSMIISPISADFIYQTYSLV
ncbi:MAG TPA: hypothetical protein H9758_11415 [Candidatus Mediterraneibacter faecipullorum]|uniref:ATP-grasp domain-containing protein n=1 Tax=Candidatus Mediterraneibacter faecipullorum TaxID=2838670 RepID=A0A9D2SV23_9FIRM|nr:hypothetical protein [Candidatus Mediterraneibacter faecipullorum]